MNDQDFRDKVLTSLADHQATLNAMKETLDKGLEFLHNEDSELSKRVTVVERKLWYGAGFTGAVTMLATWLGIHHH